MITKQHISTKPFFLTISDSNIPSWLQKIQFVKNPTGFLESKKKKFGSIFNAPISGRHNPLLLVDDPKSIEQILANVDNTFISRGSSYSKSLIGEETVISLEGEKHKRKRKLLIPRFCGKQLFSYGEIISLAAKNTLNKIALGNSFSVDILMQDLALEVIIKIIFGNKEELKIIEFKKLIMNWLKACNSSFISTAILHPSLQLNLGTKSPWGYFCYLRRQISNFIYEEINKRKLQKDFYSTDILSLLLKVQDDIGNPMSDLELHDELLGLLYAGHETTSTALTWAIYWIHKIDPIRKKLLKEIGSLKGCLDPNQINDFPYLNAVCKETLRIYPPFPKTITRIVQRPVNILGYDLLQGTAIAGCIYLAHHREDIYSEPKKFKPERFLEKDFSRYEFLPFGGGSRRCIGEHLAIWEMKLILTAILSSCQLKLLNKRAIVPKIKGIVLVPEKEVKMLLKTKP